MATTYPYQTGQNFTEAGPEGNWQTKIMSPVLGAADTLTENIYGQVDSQGRPAIAYVSKARTGTPTAYPLYTRGTQGVTVTIVVTASSATPSVVPTIEAYDAASATWVVLLTGAAITQAGTTRLVVAPGIDAVTNVAVSTLIGDTVRIVMTHADSDSITYSVGLDWM